MRPIVITIAVLTFIATYGDFVIARVLLKSSENLTVMVGLMLFQTDRFDQDFGMITAGAVLAAIPIILIYIPLAEIRHRRPDGGFGERLGSDGSVMLWGER